MILPPDGERCTSGVTRETVRRHPRPDGRCIAHRVKGAEVCAVHKRRGKAPLADVPLTLELDTGPAAAIDEATPPPMLDTSSETSEREAAGAAALAAAIGSGIAEHVARVVALLVWNVRLADLPEEVHESVRVIAETRAFRRELAGYVALEVGRGGSNL